MWLTQNGVDMETRCLNTWKRNKYLNILVEDPCSTTLTPCDENAGCESLDPAAGLFRCRCNVGYESASFQTFNGNQDIIPDGTSCTGKNYQVLNK